MRGKKKVTTEENPKVEATVKEEKGEGMIEEKAAESEEIKDETPNRLTKNGYDSGYEKFMPIIKHLKGLLDYYDRGIPIDGNAILQH